MTNNKVHFTKTHFEPGITLIHYAGRIFDQEELQLAIRDSSRFLYRSVLERLCRADGMQVSIWSEGDNAIPPFQVTQGRSDVGQVASEIVAKKNQCLFFIRSTTDDQIISRQVVRGQISYG